MRSGRWRFGGPWISLQPRAEIYHTNLGILKHEWNFDEMTFHLKTTVKNRPTRSGAPGHWKQCEGIAGDHSTVILIERTRKATNRSRPSESAYNNLQDKFLAVTNY